MEFFLTLEAPRNLTLSLGVGLFEWVVCFTNWEMRSQFIWFFNFWKTSEKNVGSKSAKMKIPCKVVRFTDFRTRNDSKGELAKKKPKHKSTNPRNFQISSLQLLKFVCWFKVEGSYSTCSQGIQTVFWNLSCYFCSHTKPPRDLNKLIYF